MTSKESIIGVISLKIKQDPVWLQPLQQKSQFCQGLQELPS